MDVPSPSCSSTYWEVRDPASSLPPDPQSLGPCSLGAAISDQSNSGEIYSTVLRGEGPSLLNKPWGGKTLLSWQPRISGQATISGVWRPGTALAVREKTLTQALLKLLHNLPASQQVPLQSIASLSLFLSETHSIDLRTSPQNTRLRPTVTPPDEGFQPSSPKALNALKALGQAQKPSDKQPQVCVSSHSTLKSPGHINEWQIGFMCHPCTAQKSY